MSQADLDDLDRVRQQIMQLAKHIEKLSETEQSPHQFFPQFLQLLGEAVGASGLGIWLAETGTTRPVHEIGLVRCGFPENLAANPGPDGLIREALSTGESSVHDPATAENPLPTRHLYFVSALQVSEQPVGAVVVLKEPDVPGPSRRGLLQFIEQMTGYASRYLTRVVGPLNTKPNHSNAATGAARAPRTAAPSEPARPAPAAAQPAAVQAGASQTGAPMNSATSEAGKTALPIEFWNSLEKFLLQLERSRSVAEVASTTASDARLLLGVERVSLARRRGRKVPIEASGGGQRVNARSNEIRRLSDLCRTVMEGREPLFYTGAVESLPPQLEQPLANYIEISKARLVLLVPLFESSELIRPEHEEKDQSVKEKKEPRVIGCLVAEQFNASRPPAHLLPKVDVLADHVAASLQQARTSERIPMRKALLAIGRTAEWFHGRKLAKTLAILGGITAVLLGLWLIPYPYRVESEGKLMPIIQRSVFAPWDGEVTELYVTGGEQVEQGQVLAVLRNDDLQSEFVRIRNELAEQQRALLTLAGQIDEARSRGDTAEENRVEVELAATNIKIVGLQEQLRLLEDRRERLQVTAPISGIVATFQLEQLLRNRPVRRGESLMEVMDAEGPWHLEVDVKDTRMGHIREAVAEEGSIELPVEFVLATNPEEGYEGKVEKIATRAEAHQEEGNVVRFDISIAHPEHLPERRIGAEVRAKIDTGPQPLGYVLFGDVIEFLYKHLWL